MDFDLEASNDCHFDYLEINEFKQNFSIFNTSNDLNQNRSTRFCGPINGLPEGQQKTIGNFMQLRLITDNSHNRIGFRLVLTATMGPEQGCGGILEVINEWKTLTPPLINNKYYSDLRCDWTLKAKTLRTLIEIRVTRLEMEPKKIETTSTQSNANLLNNLQKSTMDNCYDFVIVIF